MADMAVGADGADGTKAIVARMAEDATAWLAALSPEQRRKATFDFKDDDERRRWYYTPTERGGLPLAEMDPIQQRLAHQLVASGLSDGGYVAASTIMGIENVLDAREGWQRGYDGRTVPHRGRDPQLYFLAIFGDPAGRAWGWRFGGHHVCLHYTVVDGRLGTPTPLFFGSNPAEARMVGPGVLRPLAGEEDLGRELLLALDERQLAAAVLSPLAPTDIVQTNRPRVELGVAPRGLAESSNGHVHVQESPSQELLQALRYDATPRGLAGARMTPRQRALLVMLLRQYVDRVPGEVAALYEPRIAGAALDALHFIWAGGSERRQPHYYRVEGPRLLIEYDNTQNDANHIHAVWRDPEADFGADVLADHYARAHH